MESPTPTSVEAATPLTIVCPHCNKDFTTDKFEQVDCSGCQNTTISVLTKRCANPECENVYCGDCNSFECAGCQERFDMDEATYCANQSCSSKGVFCKSCAPRLMTLEGFCGDCAKQEVWTCDGCQKDFVQSKVTVCKNVEQC